VIASRVRVPEWMDDPGIPEHEHARALRGLARLNAFSRAHRLPWRPLHDLALRTRRTLHVLDVASGGGDLPVRLDALARRHGVPLRWTLTDRSTHAVRLAAERARSAGVACEARTVDVLQDALPEADLVLNSLFLHHFDGDDVVHILRSMARAARLAVCVTDLRRTGGALALAWLGSRTLTRSPVVRHDALASVRAAHSRDEMRLLAERAGLGRAQVHDVDAVRWRLWWEGPEARTP
jgi:SAM-dependent methyltransferase